MHSTVFFVVAIFFILTPCCCQWFNFWNLNFLDLFRFGCEHAHGAVRNKFPHFTAVNAIVLEIQMNSAAVWCASWVEMIISPNYYWSNRTAQWVPYCKSHVLCGFFLSLSMVASGFPYFYAVILIVLVDITQQEWIKCNSFFIAPSGAHGTDYSPHCFHKVIFSIRIKPRAMKLGKSTIFFSASSYLLWMFLDGKNRH